jgi:hypothetical protein
VQVREPRDVSLQFPMVRVSTVCQRKGSGVTLIKEKDRQRWEFLRRLYEATDATPKLRSESQGIIGETMGLDAQTCNQIVHWLIEHSYAEPHGMSEDLEITTLGVDKVECELHREDEVTEPDALTPVQAREIEAFLTQLQLAQARGQMELSATDAAVVDANRQTIEIQLRSPKPNRSIIRSALRTLGRILESGAGTALAYGAIELSKRLTQAT